MLSLLALTSAIPNVDPALGWPAAVVLVAFILGPSYFGYLTHKNAKAIRTSITQNNGGKSVKDYLDRIERTLADQNERLDALEDQASRRQRFPWR